MRKRNYVAVAATGIALSATLVGCDPVTGGRSWSAIGTESLVTRFVPVGHEFVKVGTFSLDGTLVDAKGHALPGTAFHEQCDGESIGGKPGLVPVWPCTLVINTGPHMYFARDNPDPLGSISGDGALPKRPQPGLFRLFDTPDGTGMFTVNEVGHPSAATYELRIIARPR
jgi:hypothetical protein